MKSIQLLIPMAGLGSRFRNAGYPVLKPFLPIGSKTMIETVIDNLNSDLITKIFLVVRAKSNSDLYLFNNLAKIKKINLIFIDSETDGPASTCNLAKQFIDHEAPLLIANSDQYLDANMDIEYQSWDVTEDGYIWCMQDNDPKWSYALTSVDNFVLQIQEKKVISDLATCGVYGFKKAAHFFNAYSEMRSANDRTNGELYVAPTYNYLIMKNLKIKAKNLGPTNTVMHGLGTPIDYENFVNLKNLTRLNLPL